MLFGLEVGLLYEYEVVAVGKVIDGPAENADTAVTLILTVVLGYS